MSWNAVSALLLLLLLLLLLPGLCLLQGLSVSLLELLLLLGLGPVLGARPAGIQCLLRWYDCLCVWCRCCWRCCWC